jgi:hypothetical protein
MNWSGKSLLSELSSPSSFVGFELVPPPVPLRHSGPSLIPRLASATPSDALRCVNLRGVLLPHSLPFPAPPFRSPRAQKTTNGRDLFAAHEAISTKERMLAVCGLFLRACGSHAPSDGLQSRVGPVGCSR